jgi:solute carrier family 25 (mitochondrial carnitine/acylcarnitine transporter), member 20/29
MSFDRTGSWIEKLKIMGAGGLAGLASWFIGYPIDFIKTKIQSQDLDEKKYKGIRQCFMINYRKYGLRCFTRGLLTVCLRSVPVNAVGFLV